MEEKTEFAMDVLGIANELKDQEDFISVIVQQIEDLYKMKGSAETTDFQLGFHIGEIYKHLLQFRTENKILTSEIVSFMNTGIKQMGS